MADIFDQSNICPISNSAMACLIEEADHLYTARFPSGIFDVWTHTSGRILVTMAHPDVLEALKQADDRMPPLP